MGRCARYCAILSCVICKSRWHILLIHKILVREVRFIKLGRIMQRFIVSVLTVALCVPSSIAEAKPDAPIYGFSAQHARSEREWESKFKALPNAQKQRDYMQLLAARPHHVGSAYDKQNAEWILARFKE